MPLADILYMEAAVLWICLALDIPAGALADIIGRKRTLIAARILLFASAAVFTSMSSPVHAWIGNILWAVGFSLQSGADSALLYDTLIECRSTTSFKCIEGRSVGVRFGAMACASLAAGGLASIDLRLPLYVGLPFMLIPLIAACFFTEPVPTRNYAIKKQMATIRRGIVIALTTPSILWMVAFAALLKTASKVWFFTYNPYFEAVELPMYVYGVIFFLLNVVALFASFFAQQIEKKLGEHWCIVALVSCLSIPIVLMGLYPLQLCAFLVIVQNIVRGFMRPFATDFIHRRVGCDVRATILSVLSSTSNLTAIVGLALFGVCVDALSLMPALIVLGMVTLVLGAMSYGSYRLQIMRMREVAK